MGPVTPGLTQVHLTLCLLIGLPVSDVSFHVSRLLTPAQSLPRDCFVSSFLKSCHCPLSELVQSIHAQDTPRAVCTNIHQPECSHVGEVCPVQWEVGAVRWLGSGPQLDVALHWGLLRTPVASSGNKSNNSTCLMRLLQSRKLAACRVHTGNAQLILVIATPSSRAGVSVRINEGNSLPAACLRKTPGSHVQMGPGPVCDGGGAGGGSTPKQ